MANNKSKPTQDFVPIKEVRDGVVVLEDNSMRALVLVSSLNFALKSEDEQQGIILQFQNFLNSLDFSIQIFVQSRELDIRPYIALLEARQKEQVEELIKTQTREYINFIKNFTENTSIMTKSFIIVIPYSPGSIGGSSSLFKKKNAQAQAESKIEKFEENRSQLEQRVSIVEQGLIRTGIRVARLGTEEIVEVFYKLFNPGESEKPIQVE
ncbi:MAG: hypothetical protein WDZ88_01860 [Candidatus Paceibacterota bacterium]